MYLLSMCGKDGIWHRRGIIWFLELLFIAFPTQREVFFFVKTFQVGAHIKDYPDCIDDIFVGDWGNLIPVSIVIVEDSLETLTTVSWISHLDTLHSIVWSVNLNSLKIYFSMQSLENEHDNLDNQHGNVKIVSIVCSYWLATNT